jgi:ribosome recycling factor
VLKETRERMKRSIEYFEKELRGIRTGRATTALIDYVKVDYYGNHTDLRELAAVSVPEPHNCSSSRSTHQSNRKSSRQSRPQTSA